MRIFGGPGNEQFRHSVQKKAPAEAEAFVNCVLERLCVNVDTRAEGRSDRQTLDVLALC